MTTLIAVGVLLVVRGVAACNSLVSLRNCADSAWSTDDVRSKRRYGVGPNLEADTDSRTPVRVQF